MKIDFVDWLDVNELSNFFVANFPNRDLTFWRGSISRLNDVVVDDTSVAPPKGAILRHDGRIIAAILIIPKNRDSVSLSSWAVSPSHGQVAYPFLRQVIKRLEYYRIYNHSAVPGVDKLMNMVGFEPRYQCVIPLPSVRGILRSARMKFVETSKHMGSLTAADGLTMHFKLMSATRDGRWRRIALLTSCSDLPNEEQIRQWSACCFLRGYIPLFAAPDEFSWVKRIEKFGTMVRPICDGAAIEPPWCDTFHNSELEILDF